MLEEGFECRRLAITAVISLSELGGMLRDVS